MHSDPLHIDAYGNIVTPEMKSFHKQRTMFALIKGHFFFIENSEQSHIDWFIDEGWITDKDDLEFETIIRGYFNDNGIFFYKGIKFEELNYEMDFRDFSYCIKIIKTVVGDNRSVYSGLHTLRGFAAYTPKMYLGKLQVLSDQRFLI